jgi:hypothetical protein
VRISGHKQGERSEVEYVPTIVPVAVQYFHNMYQQTEQHPTCIIGLSVISSGEHTV